MKNTALTLILSEGESLKAEFKEKVAHLDREIVAFANTSGGTIYIGVRDDNTILGVTINNKLKSQVVDIARNCDPSISINFIEYTDEQVLAVVVDEGNDKPYRCRDGFFIRLGPTSQKLKRNEIVALVNQNSHHYFDEMINEQFHYPHDFSSAKLKAYLTQCGIQSNASNEDVLLSLDAARKNKQQIQFTNAGILFFAQNPQQFFRETFITCVKYQNQDRFSIIDQKDFKGSLISQIDESLQFTLRHMNIGHSITTSQSLISAKRQNLYDFPPVALREAIVNAVTHRDYRFDSTHIYIHMFPDHIDMENPGGLVANLNIDDLGHRSIRRNRLIADLLHRAGYIERVGSGFSRMEHALKENNNPPLEITATNFFSLRFYKRMQEANAIQLTVRQQILYRALQESHSLTKNEAAIAIGTGGDTALRELQTLMALGLIESQGIGRATTYRLRQS